MEDPTNLMMITGVFLFDEPLDFARLRSTLEARLLNQERFRQRVVQSALPIMLPYWEPDPHFDISSHLRRVALPHPGDQVALQNLINDLMSSPLEYSRPLWQFHLVENYGQGCALLCRLHHCIGDGISLMRLLLAMTDDEAEPENRSAQPEPEQTGLDPFRPSRFQLGRSTLDASRRLADSVVHESLEMFVNPARIVDTAKLGAGSSAAFARLLALSPDPATLFKGKLGVRKHCAWSAPLQLADVKAVSQVTGGTINDVLLTAVSGALGRYLRSHGIPAGGLDIRAFVPVNLRPPDEELKLGNAFGLVILSLPLGVRDPLDRLLELKQRMDEIKATPEAIVAFGILNAIGLTPTRVQDIIVNLFGKKATAVMTNVPGPRQTRYFAGRAIKGIMFWVPQSGRVGLGVSILSYAGEILVGVATDAGLVPDPASIVAAFHDEFSDMMELLRVAREADKRTTKSRPERCQATTRRGRRCKNLAQSGSSFCRVHANR